MEISPPLHHESPVYSASFSPDGKSAEAEEERLKEEERRKARTRRNITWGSIAAAVVLAVVASGAMWEARQALACFSELERSW